MGLLRPADRGRRIRSAREAKGWKQWELAEHLGVGQSTVSYWETGRSSPDRSQIPGIAEVLGVRPEYLEIDDEDSLLEAAAGG